LLGDCLHSHGTNVPTPPIFDLLVIDIHLSPLLHISIADINLLNDCFHGMRDSLVFFLFGWRAILFIEIMVCRDRQFVELDLELSNGFVEHGFVLCF